MNTPTPSFNYKLGYLRTLQKSSIIEAAKKAFFYRFTDARVKGYSLATKILKLYNVKRSK